MDVKRKTLFVRISTTYATLGKLNLTNEQLCCLYKECYEMASSLGDISVQMTTCLALGDVNFQLAQFFEAIKYYEIALRFATVFGDKAREGAIHGELGNCYLSLSQYNMAIEHLEMSLATAKEIGDRSTEGATYCNLGICYRHLGQYSKAIRNIELYLIIAKQNGDMRGVGTAHGNLGNCYSCLSQYSKAIYHHEMFLKIAIEVGDVFGEGATYGNIGICYSSLGENDKALQYLEKHLRISKQIGDKVSQTRAHNNIGACYQSLGDYNKAMYHHEMCLNISKHIEDKVAEGDAYGNIGICCHHLGKYDEGILYHQMQLNITKETGQKKSEGTAYLNLGNCYYSLGQYDKSIKCYEMQLNIAKEIGDKFGEGTTFGNLGNCLFSMGDYEKAANYYQSHLEVAKETGDMPGEGRAYGNLGSCYRHLGQYEKAIRNHEMHLDIVKQTADKAVEGSIYGNLGACYHSLGEFKKALYYLDMWLAIAEQIGNKEDKGAAYNVLGACYYSLGDRVKAVYYSEMHLNITKETGNKLGEGEAYGNLGIYHYALGQHDVAETNLRESLQCYEQLFDDTPKKDQYKTSIRDTFIRYYRLLTCSLLIQEKPEEALVVAERGRSRALVELMVSRYGVTCAEAKVLNLEEIHAVVKATGHPVMFMSLDFLGIFMWMIQPDGSIKLEQKRVQTMNGSEKQEILIDSVSFVEETLSSLITNARTLPDGNVECEDRSLSCFYSRGENNQNTKALTSPAISSLRPKELSFQALQISPNVQSSPEAGHGECSVRTGNRNIEEVRDQRENTNPLRELYKIVLEPVRQLVSGSKLVVIADGPLNLVPYAALIDGDGRYVMDSLEIRLFPSLATARMMINRPPMPNYQGFPLIVGDPDAGPSLRLKYAEKEAELVAALLNTLPLTGKQATKENVLDRLEDATLIHIAAHGDLKRGEILLAHDEVVSDTAKPRKENSLLLMTDLENKRLKAKLVVLSCCHSARGQVKAEGVIGIARAFIGAGAHSVLVALWAIDDKATLFFMRNFYKYLTSGDGANQSLSKAMAAMREQRDFQDPRLWAPFVLIGEDVTL